MDSDDPHDLARFTTAQAPVLAAVLAELQAARKRTHWMWFVFPQLRGLGLSQTAQFYGIAGLDEARAYLAHPVLGPRLALCTQTVLASAGVTLDAIFGPVDAQKFVSCMTLFETSSAGASLYGPALDRFTSGQRDGRSLDLLRQQAATGGSAP